MKKRILILAGVALMITACKKDDDPSPGTSSSDKIVATPPPAGYIFPHTFFVSGRSEEFKAWINNIDVTSKVQPEDIFEDLNTIADVNIKLLDRTNAVLVDPSGTHASESFGYFFHKNVFFLVNPSDSSSLFDTLPLASGNYTEIQIISGQFTISGKDNMGFGMRYGGTDFTVQTYNSVLEFSKSIGINNPDTLAYFNTIVTLK